MAQQQQSIKVVFDKIMRHPLMRDLDLEAIIDYSVDFMKIMGNPTIFTNKIKELEVKDYRALLPCDYYNVIQVRPIQGDVAGPSMLGSSDSFHLSNKGIEKDLNTTYKIQNSIIHTNMKEGLIEFSYNAISVDENGYPMIPVNAEFTRALEAYIKKTYFTILFDTGKITGQVLNQALQDYSWAVGACQSEFNRMSLDQAESFYNSWSTLLIRNNEHSRGFKTNSRKENIRKH